MENVIYEKSFQFGLRIVRLFKFLEKKISNWCRFIINFFEAELQ